MKITVHTDDCGTNEFEVPDHDTHFCLASVITERDDSEARLAAVLQRRAEVIEEFLPVGVKAPELKGSVEAPSIYRLLEESRIKALLEKRPISVEQQVALRNNHHLWARDAVKSLSEGSGSGIHFIVTVIDKAHLRTWAADLGAAARKTGQQAFRRDPKAYFDGVTMGGQLSPINLKIHAFYQHLFAISRYCESRLLLGPAQQCEFHFLFDYNNDLLKVLDRLREYWKAYSVPYAFAGIKTSAHFELVDSKEHVLIQIADFLANVIRLKEKQLARIDDFPHSVRDESLAQWCSVINTGRTLQAELLSPTFKFGPRRNPPKKEM